MFDALDSVDPRGRRGPTFLGAGRPIYQPLTVETSHATFDIASSLTGENRPSPWFPGASAYGPPFGFGVPPPELKQSQMSG